MRIYQNKYKSKKVNIDNIEFDSIKESKRYCELKILLAAGLIKNLEMQKKFELIPAQKIDGKLVERACSYIADFVYDDIESGKKIVEDTKGFKTKDYIIKRKLMLSKYGIRIREI